MNNSELNHRLLTEAEWIMEDGRKLKNEKINKLKVDDVAIHQWYRFVLSFPPHLVRECLEKLGCASHNATILDPFCGSGTTVVEAKKLGFQAIGVDALDTCYFATSVKSNWEIEIDRLKTQFSICLEHVLTDFSKYGLLEENLFQQNVRSEDREVCPDQLSPDEEKLISSGWITPRILQKLLVLRQHLLEIQESSIRELLLLAFASIIPKVANVGFGPEIYKRKNAKRDADVLGEFTYKVNQIIQDLKEVSHLNYGNSTVFHDDARTLQTLHNMKVDWVITSPPYPNEKNYTRITRLESVLLGFITNRKSLRASKDRLMRSNSSNVFKGDDDDRYVSQFADIVSLANEIERRRIELGKTSGFEKLYHRVVMLYFGGMYRHLERLKSLIRPGGKCAYVVGDQMSFLMVHIKTGQLLAQIAESLGYKVMGLELWRERFATASKTPIREEILYLEA